MINCSLDELRDLVVIAHNRTRTGHQYLDRRWETEGDDKHNPNFRRKYYHYAFELAKKIQPEMIVELGIDEGDCVGHWAAGCPTAQVYGIDVHKDSEYPSQQCRKTESIFPNFHYLRGWTWDKIKDIRNLNKPIDILFIDSWHEDDYLIRDWNDYHQLLHKGSIVLVDDLNMARLGDIFNKLPGEKFVDTTLAIKIGIMIYDGTSCILPYKKQTYMPI